MLSSVDNDDTKTRRGILRGGHVMKENSRRLRKRYSSKGEYTLNKNLALQSTKSGAGLQFLLDARGACYGNT